MIHLGDISKIDGSKIEPVDVITFGSPCQDLSIAGKRKGLGGERSGLFIEAVRIIKEMREATDGVYPNYAIWENVPGAFSSNGGRDFAAVLEELCRLCDPRTRINLPDKGKWRKADYFCDGSWSIAYRVFDAQFWGVPQRRRRIALVVDFRGNTAPEILFERQGLRRDIAPSRKARKEVAGDVGEGIEGGNVKCLTPWDCQSKRIFSADGCYPTLQAMDGGGANNTAVCYGFSAKASAGAGTIGCESEMAPSLLSQRQDAAICYGIGGYNSAGMLSNNPNAGFYKANTSRTLDCNGGNPACNQGGIAVVQRVLPFDTTQCTSPQNGNNPKWGDPCHPLAATAHTPTIACASVMCFENSRHSEYKEGCGALRATGGDCAGGSENLVIQQTTGALCANSHPGSYTGQDAFNDMLIPQVITDAADAIINFWRLIVRRLTPLECERLQGYPDYWTDVPPITELSERDMVFWREVFNAWDDINGVKHHSDKQILKWLSEPPADGPRYKSLGNSIARPSWKWVLKRISAQFERDATLGSLFDGIGGFPSIWEQINGAGSARWASEIEPFPIRVTWTRFCKL